MNEKIVFFNVGWMDSYRGLSGDSITGGGKHVDNMGWGNEMFNFKPYNSKLYGYVQPKIDRKHNNPSTIKLEKLGAALTDDRVNNITVVWTATDPHNGGTRIIGWYKHATVFRYCQRPPAGSGRIYEGNRVGYFVTAKTKDSRLLFPNETRTLQVQRQKKNWMGQSNVWYADANPSFIKVIKDYILTGSIPAKEKTSKGRGSARQTDPLKRIEVEKKAILFVTGYYEDLGYQVRSFEKDNLGWDLEATNHITTLKIEVKGLSGLTIATELTSNEYKNLKADKVFYRLCVVTNVLIKPVLKVFAYSKDINQWICEDGTIMKCEEIVSARIYV